jgi:hypothetical protein
VKAGIYIPEISLETLLKSISLPEKITMRIENKVR